MASRPPRYPVWTGIAARERTSENLWMKVTWIPLPDSVYSPQRAMALAKLGKLLVAHHHDIGGDRHRPRMEARPMIPPGAAMSSEQAHKLAATGRLLIACKHCDDRIEMMVRSPQSTPSDPGEPASSVNGAFRLPGRARQGDW